MTSESTASEENPGDAAASAEPSLEQLASLANAGDRAALESLLDRMQHRTYRLALRFLGSRADAEDATQEILIRLTTRLSTFEGRAQFTTWAYTISARMLMETKRRRAEESVGTADDFARWLDVNIADTDFSESDPVTAAEYRELCEEVRISCTHGMLMCLSRTLRMAYLLGDVLGLTHIEGAEICGCSPAAFRQRLARSRTTMRRIIAGRCGLVDPSNPCSCGRQIRSSLDAGIMDRTVHPWGDHPRQHHAGATDSARFERAADQIEQVVAIGELYRRDRFAAPPDLWASLRSALPDLVEE